MDPRCNREDRPRSPHAVIPRHALLYTPALVLLLVAAAAGWPGSSRAQTAPGADDTSGCAQLHPGDFACALGDRRYLLHVPSTYTGETAVPLVLDAHGFTETASVQRARSGWLELSEQAGFVVAYPEGIDHAFNGQGDCCDFENRNDDVGFFRNLVLAVRRAGNIDRDRIFASGESNGGSMSQTLACEASDLFRGVVPVAFPLSGGERDLDLTIARCRPPRPVAVVHFHGTIDEVVDYALGGFDSLGAMDSLEAWRQIQRCDSARITTTLSRTTTCETHQDCDGGAFVSLCTVDRGKHVPYAKVAARGMTIPEIAYPMLLAFAAGGAPSPGPTLPAPAPSEPPQKPRKPVMPPPSETKPPEAASGCERLRPGEFECELGGRRFDLHVPASYTRATPVPLVLDAHGFTQSAEIERDTSGWRELADVEGFVVAYPHGIDAAFNAQGECCDFENRNDDVAFFRDIVTAVTRAGSIDRGRVFAAGVSNGGSMAHTLACEAADLFVGIAPAGFTLAGGRGDFAQTVENCRPSHPVAVVHFQGTRDKAIDYELGGFDALGAVASLEAWRQIQRCSEDSDQIRFSRITECTRHSGCEGGSFVALCTVQRGPHFLYQKVASKGRTIPEIAYPLLQEFADRAGR